jgi:hypothetical protein
MVNRLTGRVGVCRVSLLRNSMVIMAHIQTDPIPIIRLCSIRHARARPSSRLVPIQDIRRNHRTSQIAYMALQPFCEGIL